MSTNFPSALDTFTNPNGSDSLNAAAVPHAEQHANANDAIDALQAKVGINGSAVATSLDYRISTAETGLDGKISSSEKGSANGVAMLGFDGKVTSSQLPPLDYIPTSEKGAAGGVAGLDEAGKVPAAQLPSYVDDVLEYANLAAFPVTGEAGKIYVALDTNKTYRWSGSTYIYITSGAVDSVAGKTGVVVLAKADVGLGSVDDTSDANKPVSTATQSALDTKAPLSHVGATGAAHGVVTASVAGFMSSADKTKLDGVAISANNYTHPSGDGNLHVPATGTTNNGNVLKAGATAGSLSWGTLAKADVGLSNVDNTTDLGKPISTATQTALDGKSAVGHNHDTAYEAKNANIQSHIASTSNPHGVTKSQVGLSNVDNTSDAAKPVSVAQQAALDLKAPLSSPAFTGASSLTANTSIPALTITQTGTGDALRVEDGAGDATPFVISNSGQVVASGHVQAAQSILTGDSLTINAGGTGNRYAYVDLVGDDTWTDYGFRIIRENIGVNSGSVLKHRGTGPLGIVCEDAGVIQFTTNNILRATVDSSGNVLVKTAAGLGYGTGAGGTVTQATSKSTAVTLNKPTGQITMNNAALDAGTVAEFIVNNSLVSANDVVVLSIASGVSSFTNYRIWSAIQGNGQFIVDVENRTGGALSEAVVINFAIIKGATA